jgi:hypothetical protein
MVYDFEVSERHLIHKLDQWYIDDPKTCEAIDSSHGTKWHGLMGLKAYFNRIDLKETTSGNLESQERYCEGPSIRKTGSIGSGFDTV